MAYSLEINDEVCKIDSITPSKRDHFCIASWDSPLAQIEDLF